jgi:hypothetical protein
MEGCDAMSKNLMAVALVAGSIVATSSSPVHATIYAFDDMYYVNSVTTFRSIFGSSATGYGTSGTYQKTLTSPLTIQKVGTGVNEGGEWILDASPTQFLALTGWGQSLNNGQQVANVYNTTNPLNGTVLYFQYKLGGSVTAFNFNSFDLRGSNVNANLQFTLQAYDGTNNLLDTAPLSVTGNTFQTHTLNWTNVTTVEVVSTGSLPVNWGSGTLYMDNVTINETVQSPIPEPASILMLGTSLLGIAASRKRIRRG